MKRLAIPLLLLATTLLVALLRAAFPRRGVPVYMLVTALVALPLIWNNAHPPRSLRHGDGCQPVGIGIQAGR